MVRDDVVCGGFEQGGIGAGEAVFGEFGDGFEERGAKGVIEPGGGERLLTGGAEAFGDVAREGGVEAGCGGGEHQFFTTRIPAYMCVYSGRNQLRKVGRVRRLAVRGDAPFRTKCWPSKKSAE